MQKNYWLKAKSIIKLNNWHWYRIPVIFTLLALFLQPLHLAPVAVVPAEAGGVCNILITKTVDKVTAVPGDILTYRITIKNIGGANCTGGGVKVEDPVDSRLAYISQIRNGDIDPGYGGPAFDGAVLRWNAHTLSPNEIVWVEWTASIKEPLQCSTYDIPNKARVSSNEYSWQWQYSNEVKTTVTKDCSATLIVKKQVTDLNPAEPNKTAEDFTLTVTGDNVSPSQFVGSEAGTIVTLNAGQYSVNELDSLGYNKTFEGDCSGTIAVGETKICTVVNIDPPPPPPEKATLIVIKQVINDSLGSPNKVASDFIINVTAVNPDKTSFAGSEAGTTVIVEPGNFSIDETPDSAYVKTFEGDCSGVIAANETKTCTIINNDIATKALLTVIKKVINDNGGNLLAPDFTINVTAGNGSFTDSFVGADDPGVALEIPLGEYVVNEIDHLQYDKNLSSDCLGLIGPDQIKTCTIINNDKARGANLVVIKQVINDSGTGTKNASDFTITVAASNASQTSFPGAELPGVVIAIDPGAYLIDEIQLPGYIMIKEENCSGTIAFGETKTCVIINNDIPPPPPDKGVIIVKKQTDPEEDPQIFNFQANWENFSLSHNQAHNSGQLDPGIYSIVETIPVGWQQVSAVCDDNSPINAIELSAGEIITCTFVNRKLPITPATLIVIKQVINDSGTGTKQASDFTITVTAQNPSQTSFAGAEDPGVTITVNPGEYNVDEIDSFNYIKTRSAECSGTISAGETKTCVITNNDPSGGGGGGCTGSSCNPNPSIVNAAITCGPNATLTFNYGTDITAISLADNINFSGATTISPVASLPWTIPAGDGQIVFVKFHRQTGSVEIKQVTTSNCSVPTPQVLSCTNLVMAESDLVTKPNMSLVNANKGRILIQSEAWGELWYVRPVDGLKYYLPGAPFTITALTALADGISNADIAKIPVNFSTSITGIDSDSDGLEDILEQALGTNPNLSDSDNDGYDDLTELLNGYNPLGVGNQPIDHEFANQQKGRIFLQSESAGQLWYVNPADGKRYFLPAEPLLAFNVLAGLAKGISNIDIRQIPVGQVINGVDISEFADCFNPSPYVLGVADELPRTGFPFDLAQLVTIPALAVYPWLKRRYNESKAKYFSQLQN